MNNKQIKISIAIIIEVAFSVTLIPIITNKID